MKKTDDAKNPRPRMVAFQEPESPKHRKETTSLRKYKTSGGSKYVNQYKLLEKLGEGSYGIVKKAWDTNEEEAVAVKIMNKVHLRKRKSGKGRDSLLDNVRKEIAILKKVNHPNVVGFIEVIDDERVEKVYLVFEFVRGGEVMPSKEETDPLDKDKAWRYFRDLLKGLEYCHSQGIVHRDIKPENLLIDGDDHLKISDFGVSHCFDTSSKIMTKMAGSPAFLSPEIYKGEGFKGRPIDIWACGITLYCFLYGRPPFQGGNMIELANNIMESEPVIETEDADLANILNRMLEKDPDLRIEMAQLKNHPWVTKGGKYPLVTKIENIIVSHKEITRAITSTTFIKVRMRPNVERARDRVKKRMEELRLQQIKSKDSDSEPGKLDGQEKVEKEEKSGKKDAEEDDSAEDSDEKLVKQAVAQVQKKEQFIDEDGDDVEVEFDDEEEEGMVED